MASTNLYPQLYSVDFADDKDNKDNDYVNNKDYDDYDNIDAEFWIRYSWGGKKGRPKKDERRKTIMDHIKESAKKKRKRVNRMYCSICEKFNHNTKDCFKNQVEGVSGGINIDLGATIGAKSDEGTEAPVW